MTILLREFNQFDWFAVVLDLVPTELPFQSGGTFLQFFSMFVPSSMWPEKPLPLGYTLTLVVGGASSGSPPSILGELYVNFGVPGIVLGMFIAGIIARTLYGYLRAHPHNIAVIMIYAYNFASIHRFFTRSFAPKMLGYVLFMVPMLFALWFIRDYARSTRAGNGQQG